MRAEAVASFTQGYLIVGELNVTGADVVHNGVTPYCVERAFRAETFRLPPDYNRELYLVVELGRRFGLGDL